MKNKGWLLPAAVLAFFASGSSGGTVKQQPASGGGSAPVTPSEPTKLPYSPTGTDLSTKTMDLDLPIAASPIIAKVGDVIDTGTITITSIQDNPMIPGLPTTPFPPPNLQLMADDIQRTRELASQNLPGVEGAWYKYALSVYDSGTYPTPISYPEFIKNYFGYTW